MPIDPSFAVGGAEWQIAPHDAAAAPPQAPAGGGFGAMLVELDPVARRDADRGRRRRAGARHGPGAPTRPRSSWPSSARSSRCSSPRQIRTKAVEAAQDIFHTQV